MNLLAWVRHLFIPHQSNNHKARILHPASLSAIVAIFLTLFVFGLLGWFYIAVNAWIHPETLSFGIISFAVSFASFFIWNLVRVNF